MIKGLRRDLVARRHSDECFRREAETAARVSHQNAVTVYECFVWRSQCYIIQEYVDGVDLRGAIGEVGKLSARAASLAAVEVARGRSLFGFPPDDCRSTALATRAREAPEATWPVCAAIFRGDPAVYRGVHQESCIDPRRARRDESPRTRPRRTRDLRLDAGVGPHRPREPKSHLETSPHRSASLQRNRECLLGRDSAPSAPVSGTAHPEAETGRSHTPLRGDPALSRRVDRAVAEPGR